MHVPQIRAITNAEFVQMMLRCRPPNGWPSTIAVANSAGPDSTCLFFLLRRMIDWKRKNTEGASVDLPDTIMSLHVDHDLQADAKKMARAAVMAAARFKAPHVELRVPWGEAPFPTRPSSGEAVESPARNSRYQLMFDTMVRRDVHILATGHHADDQVETVLMRLGAGSSILGLGGMRPLRRFGMALGKGENDFGWFGHEGLNRWIVRPLLEVSKDRILETCHLHRLHYVLDRTNFQPELTLRNALRHVSPATSRNANILTLFKPPSSLPPVLADQIMRVKTASENMKIPVPIDFMSSQQNLREAVRCSSRNLSDIEGRVSTYLSRFSVQSPPGTLFLAADKLSMTVTDPLVQLAMVLRIMRYISPHPWGSTRAQAGRRRERLQRVVSRVWDSDPASKTRAAFEAGASVLWTPLRLSRDGRLKQQQPGPGERFGWLASRQPPPRPCRLEFDRDISAQLAASARQGTEVLHDNRFLVTFRLGGIPAGDPVMASVEEGSGRVIIVLGGRWLWPKVIWRREGREDVTIARIFAPELEWYQPGPGVRRNYSTRPQPLSEQVEGACPPPWQDIVDFKFIRILEEP
ncbi:PP-loop family-domain-containing protein [Lactarius quietus]|nr:PP-loop family-domain-containing protein [Lactarius quietus]